jgi:hypothetical protein
MISTAFKPFSPSFLIAWAVAAACLCACSSDDVTLVGSSGDGSGAPGAEPNVVGRLEPIDNTNALFGGLVVHQPGNIQSTYSAIVQGVDGATDATLRAGYETPARVFPTAHAGEVFIPAGSSPTMTKYTIDARGGLVEGATISFAPMGVTSVLDGPRMGSDRVAPDKAYYFDRQSLQAVIWDPSSMELRGSIDVAKVLTTAFPDQPGYTARPSFQRGNARQRGNRLFVPVRWENYDLSPPFVAAASLLVIDTDTDEVVDLLVDDRAWDSIYTVMTDTGDIYLFTGAYGASQHLLTGAGQPGGAIVIRNGEDRFDPDYHLDLSEVLGGRPATSPVWAGGTSVYVKAFDETHEPVSEAALADPNELIRQEAWRYWKVDLEGREPPQEITEIPWGQTSVYTYEIHPYDAAKRRLFLGMPASDFSRTTLYEANELNGTFEQSIDVRGELLVLLPFQGG